jgi:diguanylate cyclase (GGDEF)-like protein
MDFARAKALRLPSMQQSGLVGYRGAMSNLPCTHDNRDSMRADDDAALLPDPLRVLVVEDDFLQAVAIRDLITTAAKSRVAVTIAGSLSSAVGLIQAGTFDIVLLDLMLPDATGIEGLNRVVQVAPRLPVLVLTGFGREELVVRAFEHGAQDYLIKGDGDADGLLRAMAFAVRRKAAELRRLEIARRDPLTGLATRAVLLEQMQRAKQRADREGRPFAVLFLDLDGFKKVNDDMGHQAGDRVLRTIARRLTQSVRKVDTVARLGGDEFVILAERLHNVDDAAAIARKALDNIGRRLNVDEGTVEIAGSIGISVYPRDHSDVEQLLALADSAMYEAKRSRDSNASLAVHELGQTAPHALVAAK